METNQIASKTDVTNLEQFITSRLEEMEKHFGKRNLEGLWLTTEETKRVFKQKSSTSLLKNLGRFKRNIGGRALYDFDAINKALKEGDINV